MLDLYPPPSPTADDVFECERRKTGALIRYAVEAGTLLGSCSADERDRLLRFADHLGLIFQIRDDMLDRIGDPAQVGKPLQQDAVAGRKSATEIFGLDGAELQASRLEQACIAALDGFGARAVPLRDIASFAVNRLN